MSLKAKELLKIPWTLMKFSHHLGRLPISQHEKYLILEMSQTSMKSLHHLDCQIVNGTFSEVGFPIGCSAVSSYS